MSRATPDDQLKFLLNCVKHSNNGKIDFVEVAKECNIVSKGAAAKRYERLMKANGIHPNGGPSEKPPTLATPRDKSKPAIAKAVASKKRKIEGTAANIKTNDDDGIIMTKLKPEPAEPERIKPEATPNEHKLPTASLLPTTAPIPPLTTIHFSPPPHPQQLFHTPQLVYPQPRQYHPHVARYPSPLMSLPHHPQSPSSMSGNRHPMQRPSFMHQPGPSLEDMSMFEDFCTPELFESRTFLEIPEVDLPPAVPPPPQEVTMKDLSIEENPAKPSIEEPRSAEPRSGQTPSESILIID